MKELILGNWWIFSLVVYLLGAILAYIYVEQENIEVNLSKLFDYIFKISLASLFGPITIIVFVCIAIIGFIVLLIKELKTNKNFNLVIRRKKVK